MGLSNSKLRNILNKYNPQEYFKIKLDITIKQQNIIYLKKNDKLYILLFEDYLIITDKYGNEKFNISYYIIKSWIYNLATQTFTLNLLYKYSDKISINKLYFNCYNNNIQDIIDCLHYKTIELLNYTITL